MFCLFHFNTASPGCNHLMKLCYFICFCLFHFNTASPGCNQWIYYDIFRQEDRGETSMEALYRSPRYPDEPDQSYTLNAMDAPINSGYHFGQMLWGWIVSPMDGEYTFFRY